MKEKEALKVAATGVLKVISELMCKPKLCTVNTGRTDAIPTIV